MHTIGLMSGTSLDGIDGVVFDTERLKLLSHFHMSYPESVKKACQSMIEAEKITFNQLVKLDQDLASAYLVVVDRLREQLTETVNIKAVGNHGQTVFHDPHGNFPHTIQLGDGQRLAITTGLPVVNDFRTKDIILGGEGAPLVPIFHQKIFPLSMETVVVNIGGIANISYIDRQDKLGGFDTGPGNTLLDAWIMENLDKPFDLDGEWASSGEVNQGLLERFLTDEYFFKQPPKSLDKTYFNLVWLQSKLSAQSQSFLPQDVQATLTSFTAISITQAIKKLLPSCKTLICCGGGAKNLTLINGLSNSFETIKVSDDYGYPSHAIEAMMIAWLTAKRLNLEAVDLRNITGSLKPIILGTLLLP